MMTLVSNERLEKIADLLAGAPDRVYLRGSVGNITQKTLLETAGALRELQSSRSRIESLEARVAELEADAKTRVSLLGAYLDMGDTSSLRSALDAWDAALKEPRRDTKAGEQP